MKFDYTVPDVFDWEIDRARQEGNGTLKTWIWMAANGNPTPGCLRVEALRYVLRERGDDDRGWHNT